MAGARRKARTLAFQALYEIDSAGHKPEEAVSYLLADARLSTENVSFVRELVNGVVQNKEKIDESFVDDLGADSLDLVELIMSLEEEFSDSSKKIEIPDEDAEKMITVQNAVDYITDLGIQDT